MIHKCVSAIILFTNIVAAQISTGTIEGRAIDRITKQPLPGANIVVVGTNIGAATDINGEYRIDKLPAGLYQLRASIIGYESMTKTDIIVNTAKPTIVEFSLKESLIEISSVIVRSDYFQKDPFEITSVTKLGYEEIRRAPGGFEDVIRALSVLPGVAQADPGRNDLVVRGGAPSENLYVVDGIAAQNINHFGSQGSTGGPLSYINLDFVKEIAFSTGGFSVVYGDKISSTLEIDLREGRKDRIGGKAIISATQFGFNIEGPVSNSSSFILSGRRSYLDFIFKAANFSFVPEYYDVLAKYDQKFDNKNSLSFLFIGAFDNVRYFNDSPDKILDNSRIMGSDQIQYITGLTYKRLFPGGYLNSSLSRNYIDFNTIQRDVFLTPIFKNISKEEENIIKSDLIYKIAPETEMNLGVIAKYIEFDADIKLPMFITTFGDTLSLSSLKASSFYQKYGGYIQLNQTLFHRWRINAGLRADYFSAIKEKPVFSPRISASFALDELTNLNFSTGIYRQSPSYIWLLADERNKDLKNIKVFQYIFGVERRLREDIILKTEIFLKDYKNYPTSEPRNYLVLANTGAGFSGSDDNFASFGLERLKSEGYGFARGAELFLQKKSSSVPHYALFSLTYSESYFTAIDGIKRPGAYDQRWIINISGGYIFNEKWEASVKFRFATGKPYTPFNPDGTQNIENYFSKRVAEQHSLDVRIDRRWNFTGWSMIAYLDIQNIYNRKNSSFVRWDPKNMKVDDVSSIGILPSIGINIEF